MDNKNMDFAKKIVTKLRDEVYASYLSSSIEARNMSLKEYYELPRNVNYDKKLQKIDDDRFEFINGLSDFQKEQLDILILSILDQCAFNLLSEIEDDYHFEEGIGLTFKGKSLESIYDNLLSGTFFGEYFLWVEKFSEYGEYQH